MSSNAPTLTITMSDLRPVKITKAEWALIASAAGHSGDDADQANEEWRILVRQHADGRTIIYAIRREGPRGMALHYSGKRSGELLTHEDDIPAAIQRVGDACDIPESEIDDCIAAVAAL